MESKYKEQIAAEQKYYAAIGEFIVKFEHLVTFMRWSIISLFMKENTNREIEDVQIILAEIEVSKINYKILNLYQTRFGKIANCNTYLKKVYEKTEEIIKERNLIVHGTWVMKHKQNHSISNALDAISAGTLYGSRITNRHKKNSIENRLENKTLDDLTNQIENLDKLIQIYILYIDSTSFPGNELNYKEIDTLLSSIIN